MEKKGEYYNASPAKRLDSHCTASSQSPGLAAENDTLDDELSKAVRLSHARGLAAKFPEKLYQMLEDIHQSGDDSIVSWLPHGRAFRVHKKQQFVETVLPKFFGHSNYTSFTRQLNLYGFQRIKVEVDKGAYYHELFLRSHPYRCHEIVRQQVKRNNKEQDSLYAILSSNRLRCEISPVVYSQGSAEDQRFTSPMETSIKPVSVSLIYISFLSNNRQYSHIQDLTYLLSNLFYNVEGAKTQCTENRSVRSRANRGQCLDGFFPTSSWHSILSRANGKFCNIFSGIKQVRSGEFRSGEFEELRRFLALQ